jgi:hypothetical protein
MTHYWVMRIASWIILSNLCVKQTAWKNGNINGKTPTEVEATLNTIRIYPKNAAKIFHQNLYLQSSPVSDPVSFHLITINISPVELF